MHTAIALAIMHSIIPARSVLEDQVSGIRLAD